MNSESHARMPLSFMSIGDTAELVEIHGTPDFRKRMADLGLTAGTLVRVVQNAPNAPMILAFRNDARLALGHGVSHKLMGVVQQ
ncbi:MAG: ferrous iron transport protein A [Anaerolineae bacterium]|nr:ferrous iron transport protein A [Anaerolineae bacterium]